jgi:hypothetical protein
MEGKSHRVKKADIQKEKPRGRDLAKEENRQSRSIEK